MEGNPATSEIGLRAKLFGKTKYVVIVNISCFYRCVNSRHGIGTPAIDSPAPTLTKTINSNDGVMDLCPSSPLFIPLGMERSVHKARKHSKDGSVLSTDSEDMNGSVKERRHHKRPKKTRSQWGEGQGLEESQPHKDGNELEDKPLSNTKEQLQTSAKENMKVTENKIKVPDSLQEGKTLTKRDGEKTMDPSKLNGKSRNRGRLRDFYEECVEMSTGLESGLDQQRWFKVNKFERNKIKEQLTSGLPANGSASEVELSEESDSSVTEARKPKINSKQGPEDEKQQDLQKQMDAMTEVLNNSDEVEQLILRNTGLTDELLKSLATALKRSPSEVTVINLNLNQIGPPGITVLLDLLQAKPQIKELLLFGNQLGDLGVQTLLSGLAELQNKAAELHGNSDQIHFSPVSIVIKELDIGGNGFGSDGLRVLATFMRYHSHLQYLGLAQTSCSDTEAWTVLFESLKVNTSLTHIILDESSLGDNGIKLFSEALRSNKTLRKVDLDNNGFGEVGGHYLLEALRSGGKCSLEHLSLEGNYISTALMANIQQELKSNRPAAL
ncbi:ribonuclease inhibitor [Pimephales promelas]|nr:ribonuclease inhibitor [Pimephales promelas]KAG1957165.1 ribonuclease inhibitor [Pimephales promelas]